MKWDKCEHTLKRFGRESVLNKRVLDLNNDQGVLSPVSCHLSPTSTATATDRSPAKSPTMNSRLVHQDRTLKLKKNTFYNKKTQQNLPNQTCCTGFRRRPFRCICTKRHNQPIQQNCVNLNIYIYMRFSKKEFLCMWRFANIILIFLLIVNNKRYFTRKRVCHVTSPLPDVGEICAHMAKIYWQNSDFYCLRILNCNILFSIY